jgi:MFS family permease
VPGNDAEPVIEATDEPHAEGLPAPALTGMLLAAAMAPLGSTMIAIALPMIGSDIGADAPDLTQWLVSTYLITSIALQSPGGKLGDLLGHGRALVVGLSLVAVGGLLGLLAGSLHLLGVARILMASGGAATVPATMAILRNQTPPDRRARVFGFLGATLGLAAAAGPLLGGELTARFGWRAVFAANLPVAALSLVLVLRSREMYSRPAVERPSFDWVGSAVLAAGLTLLIAGLGSGGSRTWWLGTGGAVLVLSFPFWERRAPSPVVDFALFRRGAFVGGGAIVGLQNMAMYPLLFQLPVYFDRVRHVGPRTVGQVLLAMTAAMVVSSLVGGRLTERIGARAQTLTGSIVALVGLSWFADLGAVHAPRDVIPGMLLMGLGLGMTSPPAQAAAMSTVSRQQAGMAGGMMSTMRYLGGVAGISALGALLTDSANPISHQRPVLVYAGALVLAAALSLLLPGRQSKS